MPCLCCVFVVVVGRRGRVPCLAVRRHAMFVLCVCSCGGKTRPGFKEEEDLLAAGVVVQQMDFQAALDQLQSAHSDAIGAPKVHIYSH